MPLRGPCHVHPTTVVARVVPVVAIAAEGRELTTFPLLAGNSVLSIAVVAEPSRIQSAVHAWPAQHILAPYSEDFKCIVHGKGWGGAAGKVFCTYCALEPSLYEEIYLAGICTGTL